MTEYIISISATVKRATNLADHGIDHGPKGAGEWACSQTVYHKTITWILRDPPPTWQDAQPLQTAV
jgi:hypothetical protein